jgi:hypothetical protein
MGSVEGPDGPQRSTWSWTMARRCRPQCCRSTTLEWLSLHSTRSCCGETETNLTTDSGLRSAQRLAGRHQPIFVAVMQLTVKVYTSEGRP